MSPVRVSRRHPAYNDMVAQTDYLARLYVGGESVKSAEFLDQYPREEADIFAVRLKRAFYANYMATIVDTYASEVFRLEPAREITGDAAQEFAQDATGDGVTLTQFMRYSLIASLATNHRFVVVDLREDGTPYVHAVHPANLLDWSESHDGWFNWALVAEEITEDSDPSTDRQTYKRFRLWEPDTWTLYDEQAGVVDSGPNVAGRVPVIAMPPGDVNLPIRDIADINRAVFNVVSQRHEMLAKQTFAQMYAQDSIPVDEDGNPLGEQHAMEIGVGRLLVMPPGSTVAPGFIAPPDGPVVQMRAEQDHLLGEIYRLAGLGRSDPDEQKVQSGVAKAYDFRETNARLANAATLCERVEKEIFGLLDDYGLGVPDPNITYTKDFDVRAFGQQLEEYIALADAPLPDEVKRFAAKDLTARITEQRTPEEKQLAQTAVDEYDGFAGTPTSPAVPLLNDLQALGGGGGFGSQIQPEAQRP